MSHSLIAWFNGEFMPHDQVKISPEDRGFLFADGVYEGIRHYPVSGKRGGIFCLDRHMKRLAHSLEVIRLTGVDLEAIASALPVLIERNDLTDRDAMIYLQVTRGVAPRAHAFPGDQVGPTLYALARPLDPPRKAWEEGVSVALVEDQRWGRCDVKSIALLPNVLAKQEAEERGAREAVLVHDGRVTEGAQTAVVFVRDGSLWAHPPGHSVLPSVTRDIVVELARENGIPVVEQSTAVADLDRVDEMMILGTSTEVMPVVEVDGRAIGSGKPGPITRLLQRAYEGLYR